MTDINLVDVEVSATVEDVDLAVTHVEVIREVGQAGHAKIKGIVDDKDELTLGQSVEATVNDERLFVGDLTSATQNEEGIVTIEAYDKMLALKNKLVTVNTTIPRYASDVATDLLVDAGFLVSRQPEFLDTFTEGTALVAPKDDYPTGDSQNPRLYGSGRAGEPLDSVLRDLSKKLGAQFWVDRRNVIRIEPYPPHDKFDVAHVLSLEEGSDTLDKKEVIVKGGSAVTDQGLGAHNLYRDLSITGRSTIGETGDNKVEEGTFVVKDKNATTQNEANMMAVSGALDVGKRTQAGEIEVSGNVDIELYDEVTVDQLEVTIPEDPLGLAYNPELWDNTYTVRGVTHLVNSQDGFRTTMKLSPSLSEITENLGGPAAGLRDVLTQTIDESRRDRPENGYISGFTNDDS